MCPRTVGQPKRLVLEVFDYTAHDPNFYLNLIFLFLGPRNCGFKIFLSVSEDGFPSRYIVHGILIDIYFIRCCTIYFERYLIFLKKKLEMQLKRLRTERKLLNSPLSLDQLCFSPE